MEDDYTTISIRQGTWRRLNRLKENSKETFDHIILRLIKRNKEWEKNNGKN